MTTIRILALAVGTFLSVGIHARADATITATDNGLESALPGSATDYHFFPGGTPSYGSSTPDNGVLTDFSVTNLAGESYAESGSTPTITTPAGNSTVSGILFARASSATIANLTLGYQPTTGTSSFNFADFNLYVLIGNDGNGGPPAVDTSFTVTDATAGGSQTFTLASDDNTSTTEARILEFTIVGASSGDVLNLSATSSSGTPYVGAVSLESVAAAPEPSTYALLLAGAAGLVLIVRRRRVLV